MKIHILFVIVAVFLSCDQKASIEAKGLISFAADSLLLTEMIATREMAMVEKDMNLAMAQFTNDATWINSQGYFFEGKENIIKFHNMLAGNDSLDYYYEAGTPRIRVFDSRNAIAYYSWKMFWHRKDSPADTVIKETGLMTLSAQKRESRWLWVAVTNQHTPWFYDAVEPVTIDE